MIDDYCVLLTILLIIEAEGIIDMLLFIITVFDTWLFGNYYYCRVMIILSIIDL